MVKFKMEHKEYDKLGKIANRADIENRMNLMMDISACHCNGCPLDLDGLLVAPEFDF